MLTVSSSSFFPKHGPVGGVRFSVSNRARNGQFGFSTGIEFTPDRQLRPDKFGALVHARQTVVSDAPAFTKNLRINPLSVVPDPQSKLSLLIANFHLDPSRLCVLECITQRLACNPIDFVPEERNEIPRCTLHIHDKFGTIPV